MRLEDGCLYVAAGILAASFGGSSKMLPSAWYCRATAAADRDGAESQSQKLRQSERLGIELKASRPFEEVPDEVVPRFGLEPKTN